MKKKFTHVYALFAVVFLLANSGNPPNNYTGSPASPGMRTCANCHGGGNFDGSLSIDGLPATIDPNTTYNITVTISQSGITGRGGFQMDVLNNANGNSGTLSNPGTSSSVNNSLFEHAPAKFFSGSNDVTYTVDWTSPSGPDGETITMYSAGIVANGTGSTGGDQVVTTSVSATLDSGTPALSVVITNSTDVSCFNGSDGTANASASGGAGGYTYSWTGGLSGPNVSNLSAGNYTVTATDSGGATATASVTIDEPIELNVFITNSEDINCFNPVGSATALATGGTPGYSYNWSTGATGTNVSLPAGIHTVTATDANNCQDVINVTINEDTTAPVVDAGADGEINCTTPSITLNGTGSTGANFQVSWSTTDGNIVSGSNTFTPTVNAGGTYTMTITNTSNGCTASDQAVVTIDVTAPTASAGNSMTIDCNVLSVQLDGTGSSPGMNYLWTTTDGNIVSGQDTQTPTVDAGGTYTLTVTNPNNGCTSTDVVTVIDDSAVPHASATTSGSINCNDSTVDLIGNGSATGNVSYLWTGPGVVSGSTSINAVADEGGEYTLTVTDLTNGCSATATTFVNVDTAAPTADAGGTDQIDCANASLVLDGSGSTPSGNISYSWTTTDGNIVSGPDTANPTISSGGTYTLIVTNLTNACTDEASVVITENTDVPTAEAGADMTITCVTTTVTLNGFGSSQGANFSYNWTDGNGSTISNILNPTVSSADVYCLEVINNSNGCTSTDCVTVSEDIIPPGLTIIPSDPITCVNDCVIIEAQVFIPGNYTYSWTTADGNINSGEDTLTPEVCSGGTYTLMATNTDNGCSSSTSVTITEDTTVPTLSVNISGVLNCTVTTVTLDLTTSASNSTYSWSGPGGFNSNIQDPLVSTAGTYTVTVTNDDNGCTETISAAVSQTDTPTATITSTTNVDCNGSNTGSATVDATGGAGAYTYAWPSGGNSTTETDLSAGSYVVTVTDSDGCTTTATAVITEPDVIVVNVTSTDETSAGASDGTATAEPTGGSGAYSYIWSNNETTQTISNLPAGVYMVTVSDANGCTAEESVTVSSFDCSSVTIDISSTNVSCNNGNDASATVQVNGGTDPISYEWSNGGMEASISNIAAGTYSVTITEGNNCQVIESVTITEPDAIVVSATVDSDVTCFGGNDGAATVTASGGTGTLTYQWNDNGMQTGSSATDLAAGVYDVTVTDENGCTSTVSVTISQPEEIELTITTTDETSVDGNDGTATVSVTGGSPQYSYLWSTNQNTQMIENLAPGEYVVIVTDANGCTALTNTTINEFGCPGIQTVPMVSHANCFGVADGAVSLSTFGGTEPYTYEWSNGATGDSVDGLGAGVYSVTCTDASGCVSMIEVEVSQPSEVMLEVINMDDVSCEDAADGFVSVITTGGVFGYEYLWSTGDTTSQVSDLGPGTYTVTVTDDNGCSDELSIEIITLPDTAPPVIVVNNLVVYLDENGMATIDADMVNNNSFDNCGIASLSIDIADFDCEDIGSNIVILTGQDFENNIASDTAFINVQDSIPPIITCPDNIFLEACTATVDYEIPTATDNCEAGMPFLFDGIPSGGEFPSGTNIVTWGVNDVFGNPATCTFEVVLEPDIQISTSFEQPSCSAFEDGTATVEVMGGVPPFTYAWDDPEQQTTQTAVGLSAGEYNVTVLDASGCAVFATVVVTEPNAIIIEVTSVEDETGSNMNGAIDITASGGTGNPFTYQWFLDEDLISTDEDLMNLSAGTYVVYVTDTTNCTNLDTIIVDQINSVIDNSLEQFVKVHPNPNTGQFQINLDLAIESEVSISIFNFTGQQLYSVPKQSMIQRSLDFDLSNYPEGVYLARIAIGDRILTKKIVKTE